MDILALVPAGEYNSPGLDTVGRSPEDGTLTRFSEVSDFLSRLRQCICKPAVLILFVDGPARLRSLGQAGDLLSGFHIVIVLQTMDKESVALAHRLQPRVVIAREQADEELAGIVERMIGIEGGRAVETMHGAACETVTGYTAEEFASAPCLWMNMIEEGDRARVLESFSRLLDGEYVPPVEHRIIRKDGQVRWVIDTPVLRLDDDGKPLTYDGVIQDVTARKRAEDELKAASRYSRNLIEASLDPLVTIDAGGQITDVNAATETVTGVSRERLIGSDFASYFTEPEKARAVYRMVFEQGQVRDYPLTIRHTSSALADVVYNASVYRSEDGEVLGVFAAARDITERKRIEDGLRKSEARFLSYFYLPLHGIAITSVEKGWIQVNDRICSILGYRRDEIVRMTWAEMTHPDDLAADVEQFERVLSGQIEQYQMEKRFIRKDGVVVWTDLAVGCVRNPDGSVDYIIALLQDISKRKQAEEMNSRLADIVRYSDDAIISKNLNGIIASWNKGAERVYGYGEAEILGKPITLLFPPGCYEELNGFLATVAHGEHVERYETVRRRKDGTDIDVSITISPVRNAEGAIVGASTIARDITERKRAADALLRLKSLLEITQRVTKVGGWEYNVVTRRMIWTDEVYRIHGLTREYDPYNIDQNIQFYAPEDRAIIARAFQRAVSEGEPYDLELKFTTAGGRDLWVRTIGRADKIEDEVRRVYGNIMDITDRKHAEASLRESEERFKGAFQHSAIGMALVSPEGRWLKVNARFCSMVGYSEEELLAKTFQNITHPDDLDADLNYVRQMLDGTIETYSMEKRYFHKDGHIVWVLLSVALVRDSFGAPVHFVSQARDITRRKLAEAEENLVHAILDAANRQSVLSELLSEFVAAIQSYTGCKGVGIRILEKDGAIPYQAYCGFTREFYEMESPLSIHVDECMCIYVIEGKTDASRPFFTAYGSFFMNGTTKFLASVSDTDKGKTRNACNRQGYESVALIPIRSNEVISGLIHLADPRENMVQAHVVEAMERISSLMGTAIQRTIAETELHAALSEKTLLLREVHHRVKNNLAAIIGLLDLQRRSMGDVPTPAVLGGLADRIKSMALVHEHLYRNADLVHIDFEEYLKALTSHLTSSLGTRSSLHCTISVTKIEMGLDLAIPCGMIVNELVTNALKHAFPGGAPRPGASCCELTVSMTRDGATYTLIVADNGVGFPADFDWTAAKSLGLRLVRMLGEHQLGASISVDGTNGAQIELKFGAGT